MSTRTRIPSKSPRTLLVLAFGIGTVCLAPRTGAVVLFSTGSPTANTTAPTGPLADSGWQYEGTFGSVLGTPIAPQYFLSAKHVGLAGAVIGFQGQSYTVASGTGDPTGDAQHPSDLQIWKITGTFPDFAPMYTRKDEFGKPLVVIGRGTQRGSEVYLDSVLKGWMPGTGDSVQRWGQNAVSLVYPYGPGNDLLVADFDQDGGPNEAHLTPNDSSGAVFMQDGGVWKLAGINFAVDDVYRYDGPGTYVRIIAPLFDARGYYLPDSASPTGYSQITGTAPVPTSFYASRISTKLAWIYSVTDPAGSLAGDGIPNLLKYALGFDVTAPATAATGTPGLEPGFTTITYRKVTTATDLTFSIERSSDCTSWTPASAVNEIVQTVGTIQTIKAKVALAGEPRLFLRLRVTRP